MTDKTTPVVEQRHRNAAAELAMLVYGTRIAMGIRNGTINRHHFIDAFARFERDHMQPAKADALDAVERVEIDRPFMLAAARAWWAVHMGGNVRAINITGDGRVKVAWSDADESGYYTLPVDFLTALSAPASATSERERMGWQPIETAPKDELVLLFEPHDMGGFCFVGCTTIDGEWVNNLDLKAQQPTHWHPLRAIPTTEVRHG